MVLIKIIDMYRSMSCTILSTSVPCHKDASFSSNSLRVLPNMSAVAAQQFGVRRPKAASMSDDHQLHLTLVDVDQHCGAPLCVHEEDDSEERHLELRAGPDEGAANGLHHTVPAELEVQNVVILIRLKHMNIHLAE